MLVSFLFNLITIKREKKKNWRATTTKQNLNFSKFFFFFRFLEYQNSVLNHIDRIKIRTFRQKLQFNCGSESFEENRNGEILSAWITRREVRDTNENKALVWLGGALHATEELSHEIHWRHIFQVRRWTARHFRKRCRLGFSSPLDGY